MIQNFKIFIWGALISFLGTLPLGTINVTVTNISVKEGTNNATLFMYGALAVETICVCIVLIAMNWVQKKQKLFRVFEWMTALLIFALAIGSFVAALQMKNFGENIFTAYHIDPFLLGVLLSALNPLHIPFWIGWTTVLMNKQVLLPLRTNYVVYITGITIGTILGFDLFIYGGNYIVQQLSGKQDILNWIVGGVLFLTAMIQIYKMLNKPAIIKQSLA